jgi:hypothetical protein
MENIRNQGHMIILDLTIREKSRSWEMDKQEIIFVIFLEKE